MQSYYNLKVYTARKWQVSIVSNYMQERFLKYSLMTNKDI